MYENHLNGMRVIARTSEAIYIRIPEALQAPSAFGPCSCGHCNGSGKWDTLTVSLTEQRPFDFTGTIHMPDSAVAPFLDYVRRRENAKPLAKECAMFATDNDDMDDDCLTPEAMWQSVHDRDGITPPPMPVFWAELYRAALKAEVGGAAVLRRI